MGFRLARSEKGQASLMIGMMILTFLLFFTFVVNTGMLVNAKINLQNAADLAAYSGAATQARQLTHISYLNYEMRRQFKKFLFRYYVEGNSAQKSFPLAPGAKTAHTWSPDNATNYGVPAVCLIFDANDNFCQLTTLPHIQTVPSNPLDQINQTLIQQLSAIEAIRQANCGSIGNSNVAVLDLWLFNSDPTLANLSLQATQQNPEMGKILTVTREVAQGLGLVPREIILRQRINTLQSYVNAPVQKGVTFSAVQNLENGQDPASTERTIQAFLSAYYTLGENTFDSASITMDELLPGSTDQANLLNLIDIKRDFDTYAVRYVQPSGIEIPNPPTGKSIDCQPLLQPVTVTNLPLGVYKDPKTLTYYAVRVQATAKVMFSPFGDMQLKAYAAARPFGSRIGPQDQNSVASFSYAFTPTGPFVLTGVGLGTAGFVPNLGIGIGEVASQQTGWNTDQMLGEMYTQLFGGKSQTATLTQNEYFAGERAAMAPNPIEGSFYNIINDQGADPFIRNFDTGSRQASIWAPIVSPAKQSQLQTVLSDALTQIFTSPNLQQQNSFTQSQQVLRNGILQLILQYAQSLQTGGGENMAPGAPLPVPEGMNIAHITDPFTASDARTPLAQLIKSQGIIMTDPAQFKTSYVSQNDSNIAKLLRVGYSVKFVSFDSLMNPLSSDGQDTPTNTTAVANDDQAGQDLQNLKH